VTTINPDDHALRIGQLSKELRHAFSGLSRWFGVCGGGTAQARHGPETKLLAVASAGTTPAGSRTPNDEHDDCANGRTDQASTLARTVPAESLAQKRRYECAYDAQQSCQDEATWLVITWHDEFCEYTCNKTDKDRP